MYPSAYAAPSRTRFGQCRLHFRPRVQTAILDCLLTFLSSPQFKQCQHPHLLQTYKFLLPLRCIIQGITICYSAELSDAVRIVYTSIGGAYIVGFSPRATTSGSFYCRQRQTQTKQQSLSAARAGLPFQQVRAPVSMPPVSTLALL